MSLFLETVFLVLLTMAGSINLLARRPLLLLTALQEVLMVVTILLVRMFL